MEVFYLIVGILLTLNIGTMIYLLIKMYSIETYVYTSVEQLNSLCTYVNELEVHKQEESQELHPCMGFEYHDPEEEWYDDEEDDNAAVADKHHKHHKIKCGFRC